MSTKRAEAQRVRKVGAFAGPEMLPCIRREVAAARQLLTPIEHDSIMTTPAAEADHTDPVTSSCS